MARQGAPADARRAAPTLAACLCCSPSTRHRTPRRRPRGGRRAAHARRGRRRPRIGAPRAGRSQPAGRCRRCGWQTWTPSPSAAGRARSPACAPPARWRRAWPSAVSKPVLPIDTLLIVAEDAREQLGGAPASTSGWRWTRAWARVYAAGYAWDGAQWQVHAQPALYTLDALQARWEAAPPSVVAGSALAAYDGRLHAAAARRVPQVPPPRGAAGAGSRAWRGTGRRRRRRAGAAAVPARQGGAHEAERRVAASARGRRALTERAARRVVQ